MTTDPAHPVKRPSLKKRLGQHHLTDAKLLTPLLDFLEPSGACVVEIGPGGGVLTGRLLETGARVLALELDLEWLFELAQHPPPGRERLRLVGGDALDFAWDHLPTGALVAGNLPYNVATLILEGLLPLHPTISRAAFLLQKEVAERLVASPGDPAYGALSVLCQLHATARVLGRVRPGSFRPPPKVDSAFVGFTLHPPPLATSEIGPFEAMVRTAFRQRRKKLRNNLLAAWGRDAAEAALERSGLSGDLRAEALSLAELLHLFRSCPEAVRPAGRATLG